MPTQIAIPVQPGERIAVVDILRGLASFGILMVNMMFFAWPVYSEVMPASAWSEPLDRAAAWFVGFFAESKFFTLFSFLFGLGLALQLHRTQHKGERVVPRYLRRLSVLLLFGLAHVTLFWWGDILIYYALLGVPLLLCRNMRPRRLLGLACVCLAIPLVLNTALFGLVELARSTPEGAAQLEASLTQSEAQFGAAYQEALNVYRTGSFGDMIGQRLEDYGFATLGTTLSGMLFVVFAMFLLGLYAGKRRLLEDTPENNALARRVFVLCGIVGLTGTGLYSIWGGSANTLSPDAWGLLGLVGYLIGGPALSLCYAAGLVLLARRSRWQRILSPLAAVGRTALSNYLLQTLICTTLFYSYGFGLYGQIEPALGLGLTVAVFALQLLLSRWWLQHFRFGPAEWLWRSLTYGERQPFRITETARAE